MSGTTSVGAATTQGAMQTLSAVTTNALVASRNYIHSEAYDALIQLNTVLGGMGVDGKSTDCYTAVQAMKLPGTTLGDAIIKAAQGVGDTGGAAGTWIDQASLIFQEALKQGNIGANQFNSVYGLTEDNIHGFSQQQQLKSADEVINSALDKVNQLISALGGDREVLDQADDDIGSFRVVLEDTANSYLDTNYEEAAAAFKELLLLIQGALAEITQGFQVPQSMLQLINA
jgi:flagellin-like hook-associated protein FlgL